MFEIQEPFLLAIKDVVGEGDRGAIVTGRVERGMIKTGDDADIIGLTRPLRHATIAGIEMFGHPLTHVVGGDPGVTLLLDGVASSDLVCGQIVIKPGSIQAHREFRATVRVLSEDDGGRKIPPRHRGKFFFRTAVVLGEASLATITDSARPGQECELVVRLDHPIGMDQATVFEMHGGRGVFDRFAVGQVTTLMAGADHRVDSAVASETD